METLFGKKPRHDVNLDEVIAIGAAIQGGVARDVKDVWVMEVG